MKHSPLTRPQLRQTHDRSIDSTDTITLLREIKRLHGALNNAWQVFDNLPAERANSPLALMTAKM